MRGLRRLPDLARESGIKYQTLKGMALRGVAPFIRIGRGWYAEPEEFNSWLNDQRDASPYYIQNS